METTYAYDFLSRKTQAIVDAAQGGEQIKTTWLYDQWHTTGEYYSDVLEAWEDGSNHQDTEYHYAVLKHPTQASKTTYPDSGDVTRTFSDDGTVATLTDQRGWQTSYTYDDALRVTQESVSGTGLVGTSAVTYAFDALGRLTSVTDNNDPGDSNDNSTVEWTYTRESDGDLKVEETQEYGTATDRTVTYEYDLAGRLKGTTYPSSLALTYTYDDVGRAVKVNDGTDDRVEDTWKGGLLEKRQYDNDTYLTHLNDSGENLSGYGYDTFGRVKNHRWKNSSGTVIAGWSHDYDRLGNKDYQEDLWDSTESELYGYDDVYRVTSFKRGQLNQEKTDITSPSRTQTWTLDPLGNWDQTVVDSTTETRVHNSVNELTARTVGQNPQVSLTYDNAGNLTQDGSSDGDHKFTWDYRNRLMEVEERQSGSWNTVAEYKYDARGRRVLKVVTNKGSLNGTTRYIWGGDSSWQCLEERDGSDDLVARYTYSPGYIDAVAVQERDLNSDDDFGDDDEVVYYHGNTLHSTYCLTDDGETVVERYRFDGYGACTVLDADGSDDSDNASDVDNPFLFTGRRLDSEWAGMQYRHRSYSATLGRFVSRDLAGHVDGANLYCYALGGPTRQLDPWGLDAADAAAEAAKLRTCMQLYADGCCAAMLTCLYEVGRAKEMSCISDALLDMGLIGLVGLQDVLLCFGGGLVGSVLPVIGTHTGVVAGCALAVYVTAAEAAYAMAPCSNIQETWAAKANAMDARCRAQGGQ
jgi:RHS repeat-associated protein